MNILKNEKGQALAPKTIQMDLNDFKNNNSLDVYWLGGGGAMINDHGTVIMIDPLLEGFDMPLLREAPMKIKEVGHVDGILITHIDNDHFSRVTCSGLKDRCDSYHAPHYVASVMKEELDIDGIGHDINESFKINDLEIKLTPAKHNWQNGSKKYSYREWKEEDYCGYYITCNGKTIWMPGDSKLLEEQLNMPTPDVILFDFADNDWHITLEGAIKLANAHPTSKLICIHWGCVDAPTMSPFNANPENLDIVNKERILVLAPGQKYTVK